MNSPMLAMPLLAFFLTSCATPTVSTQETVTRNPPHIVLFLADDLGWKDAGYHGSGITSGASTPEVLVESVIKALEPEKVTLLSGVEEDVSFTLPQELR